jgi:hypothetical protein
MVNVITMEEREAGKKKRGFAKFKEDAKKVGKKVGAGIKKGGEAAVGLAKTALRDPALRQFAKEKAVEGLSWLAGHPLADKLSYGKAKDLKPWVGPVVEAGDAYAGPSYFGPQTNFGFANATKPNTVDRTPTLRLPPSPKPGRKPKTPTDLTMERMPGGFQ